MNIDIFAHDHRYVVGESATHPIELRYSALAALLLLAGMSRSHLCALGAHRRLALPAYRITAHSGVSNCSF